MLVCQHVIELSHLHLQSPWILDEKRIYNLVCVLSSTEVAFKLRLYFFSWFHGTVYGPAKAQKHMNSIHEQYFAF